ncbi:hypothetical protein EGW08_018163 [Elysia chlorotica]|uniref:Uncharacterized protein n=1 Tax=Elysia chlorotica TaxID=188477 RepID=A0A3S1H852_ELYCH|nr:hypothetical protein EGW08_018163 [Elysia chlorotica]
MMALCDFMMAAGPMLIFFLMVTGGIDLHPSETTHFGCLTAVIMAYTVPDISVCMLFLYVVAIYSHIYYTNVPWFQVQVSKSKMQRGSHMLFLLMSVVNMYMMDRKATVSSICNVLLPTSLHGHASFILVGLGFVWLAVLVSGYPLIGTHSLREIVKSPPEEERLKLDDIQEETTETRVDGLSPPLTPSRRSWQVKNINEMTDFKDGRASRRFAISGYHPTASDLHLEISHKNQSQQVPEADGYKFSNSHHSLPAIHLASMEDYATPVRSLSPTPSEKRTQGGENRLASSISSNGSEFGDRSSRSTQTSHRSHKNLLGKRSSHGHKKKNGENSAAQSKSQENGAVRNRSGGEKSEGLKRIDENGGPQKIPVPETSGVSKLVDKVESSGAAGNDETAKEGRVTPMDAGVQTIAEETDLPIGHITRQLERNRNWFEASLLADSEAAVKRAQEKPGLNRVKVGAKYNTSAVFMEHSSRWKSDKDTNKGLPGKKTLSISKGFNLKKPRDVAGDFGLNPFVDANNPRWDWTSNDQFETIQQHRRDRHSELLSKIQEESVESVTASHENEQDAKGRGDTVFPQVVKRRRKPRKKWGVRKLQTPRSSVRGGGTSLLAQTSQSLPQGPSPCSGACSSWCLSTRLSGCPRFCWCSCPKRACRTSTAR